MTGSLNFEQCHCQSYYLLISSPGSEFKLGNQLEFMIFAIILDQTESIAQAEEVESASASHLQILLYDPHPAYQKK